MEQSEIQNFYKDTNVLVTGGTGFMGKVLIEKLLRDTEVTTIYLLIRVKKGKNAQSRINDLLEDTVFTRIKSEGLKCKNRVEAIAGDCGSPGLGLSTEDRQKLISKIHIVFHMAATLNFDESLKMAYKINVNGVKEITELAREMNNLKALIHVSTAFSNHIRECVEEKIYSHPYKYYELQTVLDKLSVEEANACTKNILGEWRNTYTFTKALAESMLKDIGKDLPLGIYRPGIVISTYNEPIEGWIDNIYGPTGASFGVISGVIRVIRTDKKLLAEVVPVDTCVAGLIAAAWDISEKSLNKTKIEDIPVYNYVSSPENPITWGEYINLSFDNGLNYPPSKAIWSWTIWAVADKQTYEILKVILHIIPGFLIDVARVLLRKKPRALTMYRKTHKFLDAISYFSVNEIRFSNKNVQTLWLKLNKTDQDLFPLSMTKVHWLLFTKRYVKGIRLHLMKDPDSTLEYARIRYRRFEITNTILKMILFFILWIIIWSLFLKLYTSVLK